jgi:hypothetical protein
MAECIQHGTWSDNYCGPDCEQLTKQWNERQGMEETALKWVVVVQAEDGEAPRIHGPFDSNLEARIYEDRKIDAPPGARAWIVPIYPPED